MLDSTSCWVGTEGDAGSDYTPSLSLLAALTIVQVAKLALPSGIFQINEADSVWSAGHREPGDVHPVRAGFAADSGGHYAGGLQSGDYPPVTNLAPWTMPTGLGRSFQQ
ncbi:hypothetical protein LNQ03_33195 [Klebsiella pneumoniae subsp. pneumoniae]|nr:hypothetical protein [Klebsiella pneumoniae subsp. pneumoniae]